MQTREGMFRNLAESCLVYTYVGLFVTRSDWPKSNSDSGGQSLFPIIPVPYTGFGHLSAAPTQLLAKSVESLNAIPGCQGPRWILDK
jgi:hypothetical protein